MAEREREPLDLAALDRWAHTLNDSDESAALELLGLARQQRAALEEQQEWVRQLVDAYDQGAKLRVEALLNMRPSLKAALALSRDEKPHTYRPKRMRRFTPSPYDLSRRDEKG